MVLKNYLLISINDITDKNQSKKNCRTTENHVNKVFKNYVYRQIIKNYFLITINNYFKE